MAFITWSDQLSVQIPSVDEQHKKLINMINTLGEALIQGETQAVLEKVFNGLIQYTDKHFQYEENLFRTHGYPGELNHRKQHDEFRSQLLNLQKKMNAGEGMVEVELLAFLKNWLTTHIMDTDKSYSSFFMEKGVN